MKHLKLLLASLLLSANAFAGNYVGDYAVGDTIYCKFGTVRPSTGASFTLAGSPVVSAYPDNSTTQITAGITLTADFDGVTGMNHLTVAATGGNGYATGTFYSLQITTGTVDSISVTGQEACSFSLGKVSALRPTTAGRTLVVDASGLADANAVKVGPTGSGTAQTARDLGASVLISSGTGTGQLSVTSGVIASNVTQFGGAAATTSSGRPEVNTTVLAGTTLATLTGSYPSLGIIDSGTAQAGSTSTTLVLRSAANFVADNRITGANCQITGGTGVGEALNVSSYVNSTDTATMGGTWPTTPDNTSTYVCWGTAPGSGTLTLGTGAITASTFAAGAIDATAIATDAIGAAELAASAIGSSELATGAITTATFASGAIDAAAVATDAIGAAELATDAIGSAELATDAIGAAELAASAIGSSELADGGITSAEFGSGAITATVVATDAIGAAELASDAATEIGTAVLSAQGILTGTCSSGSATTCVDAARTEADATQLQDRLICFNDGWCAMLTTFNPGTDTATTTKSAPSTRASKTYSIFPSTAQ